MSIAPLTALAIPAAGVAAVKLVERLGENRPFATLLGNVRGDKAEEPSPAAGGEATQNLNEFAALVKERLAAAGIQTSIRFELTADAEGRLRVVGEHPKKDRIEQALAGDDRIASAFAQLAASHHPGQVDLRHAVFAEQYVHGEIPPGNIPPAGAPIRFSVVINGEAVTLGGAG